MLVTVPPLTYTAEVPLTVLVAEPLPLRCSARPPPTTPAMLVPPLMVTLLLATVAVAMASVSVALGVARLKLPPTTAPVVTEASLLTVTEEVPVISPLAVPLPSTLSPPTMYSAWGTVALLLALNTTPVLPVVVTEPATRA